MSLKCSFLHVWMSPTAAWWTFTFKLFSGLHNVHHPRVNFVKCLFSVMVRSEQDYKLECPCFSPIFRSASWTPYPCLVFLSTIWDGRTSSKFWEWLSHFCLTLTSVAGFCWFFCFAVCHTYSVRDRSGLQEDPSPSWTLWANMMLCSMQNVAWPCPAGISWGVPEKCILMSGWQHMVFKNLFVALSIKCAITDVKLHMPWALTHPHTSKMLAFFF